jgi:hypothetical protein
MRDLRHADLGEPALRRGADPGNDPDRLVGQEIGGFLASDDGKTAGLLEVGGDLGQEVLCTGEGVN